VSRARKPSIDILRAVAIVLMVLVHFVENLSGWYDGGDGPFAGVHGVWWLPTGFAAPTFTFLVGVSYRLWLAAQRARGRDEETIHRRTVRRGLFLIGLGLAFNVLIWLPEDIFNWDILTLIGCGLLALDVARRMPAGVVALAAGLIVAVAPALRVTADYPASWTAGFYDYDFTVADVALGWLVTGYFPIFPWLAFPLAGYALATSLLDSAGTAAPEGQAWSLPSMAAGAGFVAGGSLLVLAWPALPVWVTGGAAASWTMFPASTAYVLGTLGATMLALGLLHRMLDGPAGRYRRLAAWLERWAAPLGRHSLSIYLVHHAVHIWPLWAASLATTGEPTALWQVAMPPAAALALAILFLALAVPLCRWADGRGLPTAETLMRRLCG
jgi:uncharacterized membrane protein